MPRNQLTHNKMNDYLELAAKLEETAANLKDLAKVPTPQVLPKGDFLTIKQTAEYLGVKVCTVYGLVRSKKVPYYKPGGPKSAVYFLLSDIENWIKSKRVKSHTEEETAAVELAEATKARRGRKIKPQTKEGGNV